MNVMSQLLILPIVLKNQNVSSNLSDLRVATYSPHVFERDLVFNRIIVCRLRGSVFKFLSFCFLRIFVYIECLEFGVNWHIQLKAKDSCTGISTLLQR